MHATYRPNVRLVAVDTHEIEAAGVGPEPRPSKNYWPAVGLLIMAATIALTVWAGLTLVLA